MVDAPLFDVTRTLTFYFGLLDLTLAAPQLIPSSIRTWRSEPQLDAGGSLLLAAAYCNRQPIATAGGDRAKSQPAFQLRSSRLWLPAPPQMGHA